MTSGGDNKGDLTDQGKMPKRLYLFHTGGSDSVTLFNLEQWWVDG